MENISKIPSAGLGEEAAPDHSHDFSTRNTLQVDESSTGQHHIRPSTALRSGLEVYGKENSQSKFGTGVDANARGGQPLASPGLLSTNVTNTYFGHEWPHFGPSQLEYQYPPGHQSDTRDSSLRDDKDGQQVQRALTGHPVHSNDDNSWSEDWKIKSSVGGYYPESYERTRLFWPGDEATFGSNSWPTSPIGPYKIPLSGSNPATSAINHVSCSHATPQTNIFTDTSYPIPILNPASSIYRSPSHARTSLQHQDSIQLTQRDQARFQPFKSNNTKVLHMRQMPVSPTGSARGIQPDLPIRPLMQPSINGNSSGLRKRSRAVAQISADSIEATHTANREGLKVAARSAFTQKDYENIRILVDAMVDMSSSEDNDGMIKSWNKLKEKKSAKLAEVCEDLLVTIKRASAQQGKPLTDHKRSNNHYPTFESRFNAVSETLKTQKTVCKHLLEDPYLYQVVDDPIYASMRVTNNRRVNKGKKDAIEQGRKLMGLKGNGKGNPLIKQETAEIEDEGDDSAQEWTIEERLKPQRLSMSVRESIEEDDFVRPIKKAKCTRRTKRLAQDAELAKISVNTPEDTSEGADFVKMEQESISPFGDDLSKDDHNGPLTRPLDYYFGSQAIPDDNMYTVDQAIPDDNMFTINKHPFGMAYGAYPTYPYQPFDQPGYNRVHQYAPQASIYPQPWDVPHLNVQETFNEHHEPEPYDTWLAHNSHD